MALISIYDEIHQLRAVSLPGHAGRLHGHELIGRGFESRPSQCDIFQTLISELVLIALIIISGEIYNLRAVSLPGHAGRVHGHELIGRGFKPRPSQCDIFQILISELVNIAGPLSLFGLSARTYSAPCPSQSYPKVLGSNPFYWLGCALC